MIIEFHYLMKRFRHLRTPRNGYIKRIQILKMIGVINDYNFVFGAMFSDKLVDQMFDYRL